MKSMRLAMGEWMRRETAVEDRAVWAVVAAFVRITLFLAVYFVRQSFNP
jgi:hypothetical protein